MNIDIICIGNLKEKYWKQAVDEYTTRLSRYGKINIIELKESPLPAKASLKDESTVKKSEGNSIISKLKDNSYVIALDIKGKTISSEGLSKKLSCLALSGNSHVSFIIGGSLGLSDEVLNRANMRLSFSAMTFPHQMMRVILLEQIYRSFKIINNEPYHK